jgi:phage-related protein
MRGGFTFKGLHSSVFNVRQTPNSLVLFPLKRRNLIVIPGRSRSFVEEDGGYEPRVESMTCSYVLPDGANIYEEVRKIAGWLDGFGELTFDREPNLHYRGYISSPPPTVAVLEFAQFQLEFTMTHPFAYETAIQLNEQIGSTDNEIEFETEGTVETPVRIVIKNLTDKTITGLKVFHKYLET